MGDAARVITLTAAGLLVLAGYYKVSAPTAASASYSWVPFPLRRPAARAFGVCEITVGVAVTVEGGRRSVLAMFVLYAVFTVYGIWAVASPSATGSCGCFGAPNMPMTWPHVAANAIATTAVAAVLASTPVGIRYVSGDWAIRVGLALAIAACAVVLVGVLTSGYRPARGDVATDTILTHHPAKGASYDQAVG